MTTQYNPSIPQVPSIFPTISPVAADKIRRGMEHIVIAPSLGDAIIALISVLSVSSDPNVDSKYIYAFRENQFYIYPEHSLYPQSSFQSEFIHPFEREAATDSEICGNCKIKQTFGTFTVMNDVDAQIQIPSLLKRLGAKWHDMIQYCNHCHAYFIADTSIVLTPEEINECNLLWQSLETERTSHLNISLPNIEEKYMIGIELGENSEYRIDSPRGKSYTTDLNAATVYDTREQVPVISGNEYVLLVSGFDGNWTPKLILLNK